MHDRFFTDEELVAYLDGEDDLSAVDAIDAALRSDAVLSTRLDALRLDVKSLQNSFVTLTPNARVMPILPLVSGYGRMQIASCIAAALAVGLTAGVWLSKPLDPNWMDYVSSYHSLYSSSTLAHIDTSIADQQAELDRVAAAIGKTIPVEMLAELSAADYKRAQVLSFKGRALLQLAFLTPTGDPLALCIIRSDVAQHQSVTVATMEGLSTASWSTDGYEYLLIGGQDDALIARIAARFASVSL